MRRYLLLALSALLLATPALSPPLAAQERSSVGPLVHYGKWALLAGSVGMNLLAARAHNRADDAFAELRERCATPETQSLCDVGSGGVYLDPTSEALFQQSLHYDRRARAWLVAGEAALLGSAVLFIWEFTRPKGPPENIPFEPEVGVTADGRGTTLGVKVWW